MSEESEWPLQKIRESYLDALQLYNALYPVLPERKIEKDEMPEGIDGEEDPHHCAIRARMKEIAPAISKAADRSGNPQVWRRGEPLDCLNQGMLERVRMALKFGI